MKKAIYIPLWSYSNFGKGKTLSSTYLFTFHYGPIQITTTPGITIIVVPFTFHYGPIQIVRFSLPLLAFNIFTFHYGPIQINIRDIISISNKEIYIPLWSYSNKKAFFKLSNFTKFTFHYGPIQINLIPIIGTIAEIFTFHYGPIQIIFRTIPVNRKNWIYIPLWSYSNYYTIGQTLFIQINLHSTMVLFKFSRNS